MTKNYLLQIRNITQQARQDFSEKDVDLLLLQNLYNAYHQIQDCKTFIKTAIQVFPKLNCGITSVYLQHILKKGSIVNGYFKKQKHTFLLISDYEDKFIIDITADQFGGPAVYVGRLINPWKRGVFL